MQLFYVFWLFYKKLFFPAILFSLFISIVGGTLLDKWSTTFVGIAFIFSAPLFHYLIYEIRNKNEYYFYHNMGLSKQVLWTISALFSLTIGLTFIFL